MSGGNAKTDHRRGHQHVPAVERDQVDAHPGRAALERPDDQLHGGGDRRHFDERESEQPDVGADARLIRWRSAADT